MLAKLANVSVPCFLKGIVDRLSATQATLAMPLGLVAAYGPGAAGHQRVWRAARRGVR